MHLNKVTLNEMQKELSRHRRNHWYSIGESLRWIPFSRAATLFNLYNLWPEPTGKQLIPCYCFSRMFVLKIVDELLDTGGIKDALK